MRVHRPHRTVARLGDLMQYITVGELLELIETLLAEIDNLKRQIEILKEKQNA